MKWQSLRAPRRARATPARGLIPPCENIEHRSAGHRSAPAEAHRAVVLHARRSEPALLYRVRGGHMQVSAETRWFWSESVDAFREWFGGSAAHGGKEAGGGAASRTDEYLRDPKQAELGIKKRGGK